MRAARLGYASNNFAEYQGALASLRDARNRGLRKIVLQVDSMVVARQLRFEWRCLSESLLVCYGEAIGIIKSIEDSGAQIDVQHIYREFNALADSLANEVLDGDSATIRENWTF